MIHLGEYVFPGPRSCVSSPIAVGYLSERCKKLRPCGAGLGLPAFPSKPRHSNRAGASRNFLLQAGFTGHKSPLRRRTAGENEKSSANQLTGTHFCVDSVGNSCGSGGRSGRRHYHGTRTEFVGEPIIDVVLRRDEAHSRSCYRSQSSSSAPRSVFSSRYLTITGVYSESFHSAPLPFVTAREPGTTTAFSGTSSGLSGLAR